MAEDRSITFYHAPFTRAAAVRLLLEELGAPYDLHVLNMSVGEQRRPAYLAINPMGKVPAIRDGDTLVTELVAIYLHLADRFPEAGLAPKVDDPLRGAYLRWMVFYNSCFEPAVTDRSMKREPPPASQVGYGDFDSMLATIIGQLRKGPHFLGARFTAVDLLWGTALAWTTGFGLVPELPEIKAYVERHNARPLVAKVRAMDAELAAAQGTPTRQ